MAIVAPSSATTLTVTMLTEPTSVGRLDCPLGFGDLAPIPDLGTNLHLWHWSGVKADTTERLKVEQPSGTLRSSGFDKS